MKNLTIRALRLTSCLLKRCLAGLLLCHVGAAVAQPVTIPMPSVTVVQSTVSAFQIFSIDLKFSKQYCLSRESPLYSTAKLKNGVLEIRLSHLITGPCTSTRSLQIPGIPDGSYRIDVGITAGTGGGDTFIAEQGQVTLQVLPVVGQQNLDVFTARIDGDIMNFYQVPPGSKGPVVMTIDRRQQLSGGGDWLEPIWVDGKVVPDATFTGYTFSGQTPMWATNVYEVYYPQPLLGAFYTTSRALAERLGVEWQTLDRPKWGFVHVLPLGAGGTCPLGASPVYQLFQPDIVTHRYTQSMETYTLLANSGFIPEGPVWCAPIKN